MITLTDRLMEPKEPNTTRNARRIKDVEDFNIYCPIGKDAMVIVENGAVVMHKVLTEAWEIDGEGVALFEGIVNPYPIKKVVIYVTEKL